MDTKRNPVSALHEYAQKHGLQLEFVGVGDEGPAHMKVFTQRAILNGKPYPSGQGKNKKEARAVAAQNALECLCKEQNQNQVGDSPSQQQQTLNKNVADICAKTQSLNLNSKDNSSVKTNFIGIINHYCQKTNSSPNYIEVGRSGPPHNLTFFYKLKIGTKEYPVAEGKTRTEAKQNAAKLAWLALQEQSDFNSKISVRSTASEDGEASLSSQSDALDSTPSSSQNMETNSSNSKIVAKPSNSSNPQGGDSRVQQNEMLSINLTGGSALTQSLSFTSKVNSSTETNFVGLINQHCQRRNIFPNYIEERSGSAHNPQFSCRLKIGTVEYPVAEGKSSKEARQNAAKLAWLMLQKQLDYDCKVSVGSTSGDGRSSSSQSDALDPTESSLQNMETSSSSSIIFADSLNISNSQLPRRTGSGEKAPSPIESSEPSESEATGSSDLDSSRASAEQNDVDNKKIVNTTKPPVQSRFTSEFEIIKCLGKGGFGCVFKVKENLLGMDYAVKIVDGTEKALREVMVLAEIQHENIVRYYNCWIEDSDVQQERIQKKIKEFKCGKCLFIKMELCEFETLRHWINAKNKEEMQPWQRGAESLLIAQQIVNGVECIHSNNHIHRDLKPSNIMFGKNGKVKIGDFGLVTVDISEISVDRTQGPGTKSYMAPEQTGRRYDRKVDMFALGLIFFELLWKISTGHERSVIWEEARNQNFPPEFSQAFPFECQIIKYLLSEKPEDRPEASELKAKLEELNQQHRDQHSV